MDSKRLLLAVGALLGAGVCFSPVTAVAQRVTEVQVTPPTGEVAVGGTMYFGATAFSSGAPLSISSFTWSSSNVKVATVDNNGMVTGIGSGSATITARAGSSHTAKTGHATVQVVGQEAQVQQQSSPTPAPQPTAPRVAAPPPGARGPGSGCAAADREPAGSGQAVALEIDPLQVRLVRGESRQLGIRPVAASNETAEHLCVVFLVQPGGEKAATVDTFGVVLANDTGHAVIQVTVPGKAFLPKLINVEVRNDSVRFRAPELSMVPNEVDTLQLVVPSQNNRPVNPAAFQFQSSDPTKVRVMSIAPVVTAVAPGRARIVAQSTFYPEIPITINVHRRVARVVGTPVDTLITLAIGAQTTVTARPFAADSSVVTEVPLTWSVSDTTVARYDTATKALRGLKMGEILVKVSAPVAGDSVRVLSWRVKVIAGGLAVSRPGPKAALGVGEHVPVEVKLLDDKRQPIETASRLTWTSTNDSIARVTDGQLVAAGMGRARVTARAVWDSTVTTEVMVVGDLLVNALRAGRWDIFMVKPGDGAQPIRVKQMTQDTVTNGIRQSPTWSPTLMQIAYVMQIGTSGNSDLYVEDADGASVRRLTHDSATVASPSFVGPAGDQIAFESSKTGKAQIYVMKLDGTGRRQLTTGDSPNTDPGVSPDGRKVLYTSIRDKNYDIYEIGIDGTGERRLTNSPRPEDHADYAADGRSFYYLREESDSPRSKRVYRQDLVSGVATPLTPEHLYVSKFSANADGSILALWVLTQDPSGLQTNKVVLFNVATGVQTPVTLTGMDRVADPAFRPATPH
jgi:uncharacterized protein YjdB